MLLAVLCPDEIEGLPLQDVKLPYGREVCLSSAVRACIRCRRETKINIIGSLSFTAYICALGFYLYVRVTKTLDLGPYLWYGCIILSIEMLGATTVILYGVNLVSAWPRHGFPAHHYITSVIEAHSPPRI